VLEVSSFQAELLTEMTPRVAVFLNLSQDHLERHPDLESYFAAKQRLFALQGETDTAVLNADDPVVAATRTAAWKRLFSTAGTADAYLDGDELVLDGEAIIRSTEVRLSGIHNLANALAAALAAATLGAPSTAMAATLSTFDGLAHRHRTVHIADGVRWVDDSKATNVGATLAALRGYPDRSLHLILGGQAKGQDFSVLVGEMRRAVARLYLIGEDGPAIGEALGDAAPIENCGSLAEAVGRARGHAISGEWRDRRWRHAHKATLRPPPARLRDSPDRLWSRHPRFGLVAPGDRTLRTARVLLLHLAGGDGDGRTGSDGGEHAPEDNPPHRPPAGNWFADRGLVFASGGFRPGTGSRDSPVVQHRRDLRAAVGVGLS
jgi:hypothetical protein